MPEQSLKLVWSSESFFWLLYTTSDINSPYQQKLYVNQRITQFFQVAAPNLTDWLFHTSLHTTVYFLVLYLRICSVCAVYGKVWTIIRRAQYTVDLNILRKYLSSSFKKFKNSSTVFFHILHYQFPFNQSHQYNGRSKEVLQR